MESLSRPFHSRKLSNAASFSTQNPYDAVFTNHRRKFTGPSPIDVQDYREIFGGSKNSSIPVLDLSKVDSSSFNFRDSKPDYSNIFGGFCDKDVAVSYEELFGCDKLRTLSSKTPNSQDSDDLFHQSPNALKQFNMSYNKISPKSIDGLDGTKHVTQIPAATGFTCFVNEPVMETKKPNPSAVKVKSSRNVDRRESNHLESVFDEPVMEAKKPSPSAVSVKSSRKAVGKESKHLESIFDDKKSKTFNIDFENRKDDQKRSRNLESSKPDFDEGIDVNSDASAALRKAIEKAQESIRIAKESVGRKKNGLRNFSNKKFQKRLELEGEDSSIDSQDVDTNRKYCAIPNFMESEKLFVAKKFIDEISEKISESVKDSKFRDDNEAVDVETSKIEISDFVNEDEGEVNAVKPSSDILEDHILVKEVESEEKDTNEEKRLDVLVELQESEKHEEILEASDRVESENESEHYKQENVVEHEDSENAESEKREEISEAFEGVESENESEHDKLENVVEDEDNEYAESEKHEEVLEAFERVESENESGHDKQENVVDDEDNEYAESEKHDEILEAFERVESENESEHDQNCEETSEVFDDFCEIDAKDNVQTFVNKLEENEVNLDDDCEIKQEDIDDKLEESEVILHDDYDTKQEDDHTGETKRESSDESCDQEFIEKSSSDDNNMEEIDNIEVNDNNMEEIGNIQPAHEEIPDAEKSNEVKDSHEPESRHKEDKVEESGPSRISEKTDFNKVDEEASVKRREWEKNRLAVERVVREARERAFAEARERAERERAAVEKAKEEVRQRMVAEAHEKVSKASVEKATLTTERAKLRAERAAVERATSEARQRALEKAVSQKTASDLNRTESALRTKAKLEKHNRIMERAAKALEEKEKRDRLAQKEQAERNRLAENLDASIKRWSNGKEGNLRALLSTLQYILGPESGWQPVTLTEIITTSAVKKAYRKATLCVHPDKLQQRGATIQHKYICEKVFDLLKAAWNKFNPEER